MSKFQFSSLTHKGPVFPAEYEPHGIQVAGETLLPLAEEMLFCYARYYSGMSDPEKVQLQELLQVHPALPGQVHPLLR